MPISAHLLRKLQESLGVDAATDLTAIVDSVEATRADVAELRHEMRRELAMVNARLDEVATKANLAELKAEFAASHTGLKTELAKDRAEQRTEFAVYRTRLDDMVTKADLKDALLMQTRWILSGLVVVVLAILFRG